MIITPLSLEIGIFFTSGEARTVFGYMGQFKEIRGRFFDLEEGRGMKEDGRWNYGSTVHGSNLTLMEN